MAAGIATESVAQGDEVTLRVLVDKEMNKVVYAEVGNDFVDPLFNFLTLPLLEQSLCSMRSGSAYGNKLF